MNKFVFIFTTLLFAAFLIGCVDDNDPNILIDDRDAFLGIWNVSETCTKDAYTVTIIKDPGNSVQVLLKDFYHVPFCQDPAYAIIAGKSMVMPLQSFCSNSFDVSGSGNLNKNKITMNYTISDGADEFKCTAFFEKQ